MQHDIRIGNELVADDPERIEALVRATGVFHPQEEAVARELAEESLADGAEASGYYFLLGREEETLLGYACYGPVPLSEGSWDLYWLAVHPQVQGRGLAAALHMETVRCIATMRGRHIYAETSGTDPYAAARRFYLKSGYEEVARLPDFYRPGDDKIIYCKRVGA